MKRIQIASTGKRILSGLIDLALMVGLTCLFYFCVFTKVVASVQHYDEANEVIKEQQLASHLYEEKDGKLVFYLDNHQAAKSGDIENVCTYFYTTYLKSVMPEKKGYYDAYWFRVFSLRLPDDKNVFDDEPTYEDDQRPFKWTDKSCANYERKDPNDEQRYYKFFANLITTANLIDFYNVPAVSANVNKMNWGNVRALIYSSLVGTVIPFLVVPLCLKNGKSVGKLATGLIVLTDEGYYYARWKHIIRYLAFYLVEVFGGVVTIGLTVLFSTCLVIFSMKKRALHDYVAFACVANEKETVFFKDEEEELAFKEKNESVLQKIKP